MPQKASYIFIVITEKLVTLQFLDQLASFADDSALISEEIQQAQALLQRVEEASATLASQ